ncbi:hypothetical protein JAO29_09465 [Edaphobacter sp. HDX4]|uniref:hypothetical protein n=1 Tax=Edaphobacter sp. HDX4 TaxID=2794064 RepID=UPI002FE57576
MRAQTPARLSLLLCLAAPLFGQSHSIPQPVNAAPQPSSTPAVSSPNRPRITYLDHQLTVTADNSSLNQILHEVSQIAGITITGGVTDERVFGSYGPAPASQVLNQLLDGTSSNMLFVSSTPDKPAELILTPRAGGPTPPNPNAMRFDDDAESDTQPVNPPEPPDESSAPPPAAVPPPPPAAQPAANSNASSSPDSKDDSSNGAKTPQQIFDQLMKLRQQQHQTQPQ